MNANKYLDIFIEETKEHLSSLNQCLLQLEQDAGNIEVLNEIFRAAHTLKGMSGTMGFTRMAKLTHDMENVLQALRNKEIYANTHIIDVLFKCLDALDDYLNNIISSGQEGTNDNSEIIAALNKIISKDNAESNKASDGNTGNKGQNAGGPNSEHNFTIYEYNAMEKALEMGLNTYSITVILSKDCILKSARAYIVFNTLEKYSDIIRSVPSIEDIEDEKFEFEFSVLAISKESGEFLEKELTSVSEVEKVIIDNLNDVVANTKINEKNELADDSKKDSDSNAVNVQKDQNNQDASSDKTAASKLKTGKTLRIDIERLDTLMNLTGELIITKTRLKDLARSGSIEEINDTVEYLERITTKINDAVMKVRMVPLETVFSRFPRMVRDIARDIGKEISLVISGQETEVDKTVIDEIGEPLIHLIRNSADHGIETAEERQKIGKPSEGHIYLRAYQDSNNVVIEVEDDGKGIDTEKIKKKAVEKGFITKEKIEELTESEIIELLFMPSFSTADKITDISGRGVGLDVVKTKIEALGGFVEVTSNRGKGSKFTIRIPLTLAIIQALLVMVGNEKYTIPLASVKQIVNITKDELKVVQKQEVFMLRNSVIPVIRLKKVLGVVSGEEEKQQCTLVIVKKGEKVYGLMVDSIMGQQEIVQKPLGKLLSGVKTVTGATILGNGDVALILDVNNIV